MTSETIEGVVEPSGDAGPQEKPQEWWAVYRLEGRDVHFVAPTPEQLMVLRRLSRQLSQDNQSPGRVLTTIAKVLDAVSACMSSDAERDYADQLVLDRKIDIDVLSEMIQVALAGPGLGGAPAKKAAPRRVRRR